MTALEKENFYASTGTLINELTFDEGILHIECSEAKSIILNTDKRIAMHKTASEDESLNRCDFDLRYWLCESSKLEGKLRDDSYFRVTVISHDGKKAWTNAYFYNDIIK